MNNYCTFNSSPTTTSLTDLIISEGLKEDANPFLQDLFYDWYNLADNNKFFELGELISKMKQDQYSYIRLGICVNIVRVRGLWNKFFHSFSDFCRRILNREIWRINNLIEAARVGLELAYAGFDILPQNESQAKLLSGLTGGLLVETWGEILRRLPNHKITSKGILTILNHADEPRKQKQIKIRQDFYDVIEQRAKELGITPKDYIEHLVLQELQDEETDIENSEKEEERTETKQDDKIQKENPSKCQKPAIEQLNDDVNSVINIMNTLTQFLSPFPRGRSTNNSS